MLQIAVCDDVKSERERLIPILREYLSAKGLEGAFAEFESGEALTASFAPGKFDLIFLDIYMQGIDGIKTAEMLKAADPNCTVIFTTTSREHGAQAFDIEAFHYLVKPIDEQKLLGVLDKWYALRCEVKTVSLKCGRAAREVFIRDILYIEVRGRVSSVHTEAEVFETSTPLSAIVTLLPAGEFCRPIRYCLASLRHIVGLAESFLTLSNGEMLPVTRSKRDNIKNQLAAYRLRALRGR